MTPATIIKKIEFHNKYYSFVTLAENAGMNVDVFVSIANRTKTPTQSQITKISEMLDSMPIFDAHYF